MRFEIYQAKGSSKKNWGWRLVEENNRIIADTQGYDTEAGVRQSIEDLQSKAEQLAGASVNDVTLRLSRQLAHTTRKKRNAFAGTLLDLTKVPIK